MKVSAQKAEIVKLKADGLCFDSIKKAPAENKGDSEQRVISDNYGATYFFVTIRGREKKIVYIPPWGLARPFRQTANGQVRTRKKTNRMRM